MRRRTGLRDAPVPNRRSRSRAAREPRAREQAPRLPGSSDRSDQSETGSVGEALRRRHDRRAGALNPHDGQFSSRAFSNKAATRCRRSTVLLRYWLVVATSCGRAIADVVDAHPDSSEREPNPLLQVRDVEVRRSRTCCGRHEGVPERQGRAEKARRPRLNALAPKVLGRAGDVAKPSTRWSRRWRRCSTSRCRGAGDRRDFAKVSNSGVSYYGPGAEGHRARRRAARRASQEAAAGARQLAGAGAAVAVTSRPPSRLP